MKPIVLTLFIIPFLLILSPNKEPYNSNIVVLELFTSQGCSSCPAADAILNEVKSENIIALSYHVDYWNYIGWKDPFSKSKYSDKQRKYAVKFNSSSIYTPQLVINGKEHIVGSNKKLLNQKIEQYKMIKSKSHIFVSKVSKSEDQVRFSYNFEGDISNKNFRIILVVNERKTSVKRGENRNREIVNGNIVVNEQQFKLENNSGIGSILIPEIVTPTDDLSLILIIENDDLDIATASYTAL
ncbi:DUF1223 domain-containing protein [Winogradskyella sp.]|uniref:DUF1223 domain-containing protein n=1 Tax=Winogradskyella sp. TaxID=1883156 RepID=UPI0025E873AE|nr:DUF1223 domain-containing protein [Winogradskyella sp.]